MYINSFIYWINTQRKLNLKCSLIHPNSFLKHIVGSIAIAHIGFYNLTVVKITDGHWNAAAIITFWKQQSSVKVDIVFFMDPQV